MFTRWKFLVGGIVAATTLSGAAIAVAGGGDPACGCMADPGIVETTTTTGPNPPTPTVVPPPVSTDDRTITVSGSGTVKVEPDIATVSLGVEANAATGDAAMEQVNTKATALTDALVASGIAEEDIQTSGLSLWSTTGDDGVTVTGYRASLSVNVTVRDIEAVGATIDAAQEAAGEGFTIGGVSFSFEDPESVLEQARIDALANARTIAEQYAAAAGATLGEVVAIVDGGSQPPVIFRDQYAEAATTAAAGPPISPGQLDLTVYISATFAIS